MKNLWIIIVGILAWAGTAAAQEAVKAVPAEEKTFLQELEKIRDPFVSPLKKPKVEVPEPPKPVPVPTPEPPKPMPTPLPTPVQPFEPPPIPLPVIDVNAAKTLLLDSIRVNGIIWNADMPQAIVNDRVFKVGEEVIEGARISAIKKEGIEVVQNGIKHTFTLSDYKK